jgi:hypothetical protein
MGKMKERMNEFDSFLLIKGIKERELLMMMEIILVKWGEGHFGN